MLRRVLIAAGVLVLMVLAAAGVGSLLPQGHVARAQRTFSRPATDVYSAIADVALYPEWRTDVREVRVLHQTPLRWAEEGSNGPITFEVEDAAPPRRLVVRIADPDLPFGGRWIYELQENGGHTRLAITEEGEVYNPIFRLLSRFVFSHTATIEAYLDNLGRRLERR